MLDNDKVNTTPLYAIGVAVTRTGDYTHEWADGSLRRVGECKPADYATRQPDVVPVLLDHQTDLCCGRVVYLERASTIVAVAEVNPAVRSEADRLYFSPGFKAQTRYRSATHDFDYVNYTAARLEELSLTPDPATTNLGPVWFVDRLSDTGLPFGIPDHLRAVAARAGEHVRQRKGLEIVDHELDQALARVVHRTPAPVRQRYVGTHVRHGIGRILH